MSSSRQLAAIMFTDIVGYTAMMGEDEDKAFDLLGKNRQIQQPLIERFDGKWIKELGDGVLASFTTVIDAVMCAISIQQSCREIPGLKLRIGIHLGDVIFENNDVFGDGVNIASRLLAQAPAGGICISESVHNTVANKKGITTIFLREEMLKNVKEPVRIYEVTVESAVAGKHIQPLSHEEAAKKIPDKSIAVMPFVNMSNDPDQEYFSDGMAEEILNSLSHVKELKVAGRTSSFQFKGKNVDLREVGAKLFVRTVLEGSVRKQGNRLRITAQLVNVEDGYHLWSEKYDREMNDIFAIQDEIALAITEQLKITLLEKEKELINRNPTDHTHAYDLYLKGRFYLNKRGGGLKKALEYFQQASDIDPEFSLAYSGTADVYSILSLYCSLPPHVAMPKARENAEKAIQLDPHSAEALTTLAFISFFYDWNWEESKKRFRRVFEINADYAPAHYWYSYYLSFVERKYEEGIKESRKAAKYLEPLVPVSHHVLAMMLNNAGKFEEALLPSKTAIELDATTFPGYRSLGLSLAGLERYDESIEALKTSALYSARHPLPLVELAWVHSLKGEISESQKILDEFILRSKTEFISAMFLACVAYFSQKQDEALVYMEQAFEQKDGTFPCINVYQLFSFVRTDPRFKTFIERMKFPE
jgi:TolB-like protein/class 3 adenylate cyclase